VEDSIFLSARPRPGTGIRLQLHHLWHHHSAEPLTKLSPPPKHISTQPIYTSTPFLVRPLESEKSPRQTQAFSSSARLQKPSACFNKKSPFNSRPLKIPNSDTCNIGSPALNFKGCSLLYSLSEVNVTLVTYWRQACCRLPRSGYGPIFRSAWQKEGWTVESVLILTVWRDGLVTAQSLALVSVCWANQSVTFPRGALCRISAAK